MRYILIALLVIAALLFAAPAQADSYWYVNVDPHYTFPSSEMPGHGCEYLRTDSNGFYVFRCNKNRFGRVDAKIYFLDKVTKKRACLIVIEQHTVKAYDGCGNSFKNANTVIVWPAK